MCSSDLWAPPCPSPAPCNGARPMSNAPTCSDVSPTPVHPPLGRRRARPLLHTRRKAALRYPCYRARPHSQVPRARDMRGRRLRPRHGVWWHEGGERVTRSRPNSGALPNDARQPHPPPTKLQGAATRLNCLPRSAWRGGVPKGRPTSPRVFGRRPCPRSHRVAPPLCGAHCKGAVDRQF